jgi:site-specific DNA-methyltransferase (adenine-specific)
VVSPYYADDLITLYHGDAFEVMDSMSDQSVDAVLTDPPYDERTHQFARSNSTQNSVSGRGSRVLSGGSTVRFEGFTHDVQIDLFATLGRLTRRWVVSHVATDTAFRFEVDGPPPGLRMMRVGAWVKTNPMPMISADRPGMGWEAMIYLLRDDVKPSWNGGGRAGNFVLPTQQGTGHPTAKPLTIAEKWVEWFTEPGDLIFDPFAGTGPVLRAAKSAGRRVIACENSERWCEFIANRLTDTVRSAEGSLF